MLKLSVSDQRETEKPPQNALGGVELASRAALALLYIGVTLSANFTLSLAPRRNSEPRSLLEPGALKECGGPYSNVDGELVTCTYQNKSIPPFACKTKVMPYVACFLWN